MQNELFLLIYRAWASANPIICFCSTSCPRERLVIFLLMLWNANFHKQKWIDSCLIESWLEYDFQRTGEWIQMTQAWVSSPAHASHSRCNHLLDILTSLAENSRSRINVPPPLHCSMLNCASGDDSFIHMYTVPRLIHCKPFNERQRIIRSCIDF